LQGGAASGKDGKEKRRTRLAMMEEEHSNDRRFLPSTNVLLEKQHA
jgi:hypothetical protein